MKNSRIVFLISWLLGFLLFSSAFSFSAFLIHSFSLFLVSLTMFYKRNQFVEVRDFEHGEFFCVAWVFSLIFAS